MRRNRRKRILAMWMLFVVLGTCVTWTNPFYSLGATSSITVKYGGKKHTFPKKKQTSAKINGKKVKTVMPGIIIDGTNLVSANVLKDKKLGINYKYNTKNKLVTLKRQDTVIKIKMGSKYAHVNGKKTTMGIASRRMYYVAKKKYYNMFPARFVFETFGFEYEWVQSSRCCEIKVPADVTTTPKVTKEPEITATPKVTKEPEITATPKVTKEPEITATPKVTKEPEITATPKVTKEPEITATPKVTKEPEITATPKVTKEPEITEIPKVTKEPEITAFPQITGQPEYTDTPQVTIGPVVTQVPSQMVVTGTSVEMRAMWISYLEFGSKGRTEEEFTSMMETMFDNCVSYGMNAVIVQVRPFSDAMYPSKYFPWSKHASGKLGKDPGYDPLEIMVELAHARGLEFHAWLNPYRVTLASTNASALPENHPARKWMESDEETLQRNVISFGGNLYYNPSSAKVRTLITNGVKEIVENYEVDGIHFDDYFYPQLGSSYKTVFDAKEYNEYVDTCSAGAITPKSIVSWRRGNVNSLVKKVYKAVKDIDSDVVFGISPAGNIDNLLSSTAYYANVKTWMEQDGYVDYICPQIYWSFKNKTCPFEATTKRWASLKVNKNVKLYIGLGVYRAGSNEEAEWSESDDVLKRQILCARNILGVDGFGFYRYESFTLKRCEKEINNMVPLLKIQ